MRRLRRASLCSPRAASPAARSLRSACYALTPARRARHRIVALIVTLLEVPHLCGCSSCCHWCSEMRLVRGFSDNLGALSTLYATLSAWGMWISVLPQPESWTTEWLGNDGKWSITISFLVLELGGLLYLVAHSHGEGVRKPSMPCSCGCFHWDAVYFLLANLVPTLTPLVVAWATPNWWRISFHGVLVASGVVVMYLSWYSTSEEKATEPTPADNP